MKTTRRWAIYLAGLLTLGLGLSLSAKTGLGSSPIISVAYGLAEIFEIRIGYVTAIYYALLVGLQFLLRGKNARLKDLGQFGVTVLMSVVLDTYATIITLNFDSVLMKAAGMMFGFTFTGIGACMMLNMELAASPADALVQTISDISGKSRGFCKNIADLICASLTACLGLFFAGRLAGVGLGTAVAVVMTGRVMALFDKLTKEKMRSYAGVEERPLLQGADT